MPDFNNKMHQNRNRLGLCPRPHWGSSRRSPRPPSRMERGTPLPIPYPLGAFGASILAPSALDLCAVKNFPYFKPWFLQCQCMNVFLACCCFFVSLCSLNLSVYTFRVCLSMCAAFRVTNEW